MHDAQTLERIKEFDIPPTTNCQCEMFVALAIAVVSGSWWCTTSRYLDAHRVITAFPAVCMCMSRVYVRPAHLRYLPQPNRICVH